VLEIMVSRKAESTKKASTETAPRFGPSQYLPCSSTTSSDARPRSPFRKRMVPRPLPFLPFFFFFSASASASWVSRLAASSAAGRSSAVTSGVLS